MKYSKLSFNFRALRRCLCLPIYLRGSQTRELHLRALRDSLVRHGGEQGGRGHHGEVGGLQPPRGELLSGGVQDCGRPLATLSLRVPLHARRGGQHGVHHGGSRPALVLHPDLGQRDSHQWAGTVWSVWPLLSRGRQELHPWGHLAAGLQHVSVQSAR